MRTIAVKVQMEGMKESLLVGRGEYDKNRTLRPFY